MNCSLSLKKNLLINLTALFSIVFFDQASKSYMLQNIGLNETENFISGLVRFFVVQNTGGAFSIFKQFPQYFLVFGVINILIFSYIVFFPSANFNSLIKTGCTFILAGTVGNSLDRIFHGAVIDFIDLEFINFAVFNIADISINIGAILILFGWYTSEEKQKQSNNA